MQPCLRPDPPRAEVEERDQSRDVVARSTAKAEEDKGRPVPTNGVPFKRIRQHTVAADLSAGKGEILSSSREHPRSSSVGIQGMRTRAITLSMNSVLPDELFPRTSTTDG